MLSRAPAQKAGALPHIEDPLHERKEEPGGGETMRIAEAVREYLEGVSYPITLVCNKTPP